MMEHETIRNELEFYKNKFRAVHITLSKDRWLNGKVIDVSEDRFILDEEKFGEMLVFFDRIVRIEPREVR